MTAHAVKCGSLILEADILPQDYQRGKGKDGGGIRTGSSACRISRMKVARVDTVPRNVLTHDNATNAELGTENRREKGYIIGVMAHLQEQRYQ